MKRPAIIAILTLLCFALHAWAAGETPNFSGTWILDQANSDPFPLSRTAMNDSGIGDVSRGGGGRGGGRGGGGEMRGGGGGVDSGMAGRGGSGSARSGTGGAGEPVPLVIEQNGNEVKISSRGMVEILSCDGKQFEKVTPLPNSNIKLKEKTKSSFKKNKLVVEKINYAPTAQGMQLQTLTKRTYSLSEDGKSLTLETTIENTMSSMIQKQIYNRQ